MEMEGIQKGFWQSSSSFTRTTSLPQSHYIRLGVGQEGGEGTDRLFFKSDIVGGRPIPPPPGYGYSLPRRSQHQTFESPELDVGLATRGSQAPSPASPPGPPPSEAYALLADYCRLRTRDAHAQADILKLQRENAEMNRALSSESKEVQRLRDRLEKEEETHTLTSALHPPHRLPTDAHPPTTMASAGRGHFQDRNTGQGIRVSHSSSTFNPYPIHHRRSEAKDSRQPQLTDHPYTSCCGSDLARDQYLEPWHPKVAGRRRHGSETRPLMEMHWSESSSDDERMERECWDAGTSVEAKRDHSHSGKKMPSHSYQCFSSPHANNIVVRFKNSSRQGSDFSVWEELGEASGEGPVGASSEARRRKMKPAKILSRNDARHRISLKKNLLSPNDARHLLSMKRECRRQEVYDGISGRKLKSMSPSRVGKGSRGSGFPLHQRD